MEMASKLIYEVWAEPVQARHSVENMAYDPSNVDVSHIR